jgi:hypothetical protein
MRHHTIYKSLVQGTSLQASRFILHYVPKLHTGPPAVLFAIVFDTTFQ